MEKEASFGIIPLRKIEGNWQVAMVQLHAGHWSFPKGHPDANETPQQTAIRELTEETGLTIARFLPLSPFYESYTFTSKGRPISKTVTYFPAEVTGTLSPQAEEIADCQWISLADAEKRATFPATKQVCLQLRSAL